MTDDYGIAGEAHGLVHGERVKSYGHPRKDFRIIAKVWSGLLQDVLKEGEEIDEYRVAVLMTGLKLARLVKSPGHHDSRVDTIGYMLTMERLDEPEQTEDAVPVQAKLLALRDSSGDYWRPEDDGTFTYYSSGGTPVPGYQNLRRSILEARYPGGITEMYQHYGKSFPWER